MLKRVLFIINPVIRKRKKKKILLGIAHILDKNSFDYKIQFSDFPGHTAEIVRQNIDGFDVFVAAGGDGTINEISKVLVGTEKILGIIPTGSGNGLARHLKIPLNIFDAIKKINQFHIRIIDTVNINEYTFVNVAGIGFDALVAHKFSSSVSRGFFSYSYHVLKEFIRFEPIVISMVADGEKYTKKVLIIAIANSSQFGYNAFISPLSHINDGFFEICCLKKFPVLLFPLLAVRLFTKTIHKSKYFEMVSAKEAKLEHTPFIHVDGEPLKISEIMEIKINPTSLKVIA